MVPYVEAGIAVTVMRLLLFVLHVRMMRECEGDGIAEVVVVSAGHVGDTRGSGIVSSAADVLWMSVVRGIRGVSEVCEICMCLFGAAWLESG